MSTSCKWKGVSISQIIGSDTPWGAPEFPLVQPAHNHTVLYHIPTSGAQLDRPPKPQIGKDKWDQDHVRMPFSSRSLYPVENIAGKTQLNKRWDMIQNALNRPIRDSKELANAILSYNTKFKNRWRFASLHELFEEHLDVEETRYFFDVTLPEMVKLALSLPKLVQSPIPLLKQNKNHSVSLSQQQVSSLLANAFFCTFPRRNTTKRDSEYSSYPHINFNVLYECSPSESIMEKLKCICFYFRRVCTKVPVGVLTVSRRATQSGAVQWARSSAALAALRVHVDAAGTIEDAHGLIQVDFANRYLGGGVLGYGCVQEEIRFMICPELIITMLFTEALKSNEALMIIGCEQYSKYSGYGHSFQWAGEYVDRTPYDCSGRRRCSVLAIDALPSRGKVQEYRIETVTRELNKAWVGFSFYTGDDPGPHFPGVATGNWGCGAFGGSAPLKVLIQMMALTQAGRPMAYYTFGDVKLRDDIIQVYELLAKHNVTVGQLYELIYKFCKGDIEKISIFSYLEQILEKKVSSSKSQPMDYSDETEKYAIPASVEEDFNRSPEMFTPDEDDEVTVKEELSDANGIDTSSSEQEVTNKTKTGLTSRLFDAMEKIDNDSGQLNLKSPQKSIFRQNSEISESSMDVEEKLQTDLSSNDKKKLARKITDYFSKKPL
ncbi:poly(ADP-ribose) glycohydrolase [Melitaea cinxia]|uniref:poly(ADP-ribose) glycohydrolase n=1 Tax=Melitaea cinxia TaxID=113334 RepID=UPI001E271F5D|nr:poly(ADP-ribose) glycohydrolase [Melitaea cinxia]